MPTTYALRLRSEVDVSEADGCATFSLWYGTNAEALTIRVEPLSVEEIEARRRKRLVVRTHVVRDRLGPEQLGRDRYFASFEDAVQYAIDDYRDAEAQHFTWAWGLADR